MFLTFLIAVFSIIMAIAAFDLIASVALFASYGTTDVTRKQQNDCYSAIFSGIIGGVVLYCLVVIGFCI